MSNQSACNLSYLTGNFYECCPAFVQNSELILFAAGSIVNIVSSSTGNVVGVFREHHNLITAINVVEKGNNVVVYSASVDGSIFSWDLNTLQVIASFNIGVPVYDLSSIIAGSSGAEKVVVVSSVAKASAEKKRKFNVLNFDVASQKVTTKLSSLQFPRRCTAVLRIPLSRILAATGQVQSMGALYQQQDQAAAVETVLVVATSRKISFIPLSGEKGTGTGVVHFVPDADNRRGAITCIAASSHDEGVLVTGHEKGSIVVWHNIVTYYLTALANATSTTTASTTTNAAASKSEKKKELKKAKQAANAESTVAMPISTTLHWHAHSVHAVSLTTDGSTLFSGGAEGVLVVWHNVSTTSSTGASKSFFPRLGCPISFLTNNSSASLVSGINVAVTTTDNAVHVINTATMREDWTVRSLCITSRRESVPRRRQIKAETDGEDAAEVEEVDQHQYLGINRGTVSRLQAHTLPFIQSDYHWRATLAVEPRSQWLVCNGYPGQLQAFDRNTQSLSHAYQIVDYTRVSKKEANSKMFVPSISHSQFVKHPLGWFLGTVDVRKGAELEAESSLKFFEWSDLQSKYRLGAQMDNPHGPHRVTALAFAGVPSVEEGHSSVAPLASAAVVVAATASVDGTVKVWRAERSEVPAQPTLSTAAKRALTTTTSNTAANSTGSASSETEAALPLKWVCAYSFKYRDSPATSLAFSRDGTLLAVAHRNLLSLWDPATVSMKASIVCPTTSTSTSTTNTSASTSNSILYTAFIEPKAASSLGGGCGSAYMFVGTQNSISVYDLLTLQLVWTQSGDKYTAFSVAADESQLPSTNGDAWIAVSLTTSTSVGSTGAVVKVSAGADTDGEESVDGSELHKVLLYSPYSSVPLSTHTLPAKASSLVFCPATPSSTSSTTASTDSSEGTGRGIAVSTESCEMLFLTVGGSVIDKAGGKGRAAQVAAKVGEQTATVYKVSVPALASTQQSEVVHGISGSTSAVVQGVPLPITKPGWLRDYFDEHSENIPSLAAISSGFFANFRSAPSTTASVVSAGASTAAGGSVSASAGASSGKVSRKRSAQQMSTITPAVVAVSQDVWDESLISFFSGTPASTTTSTSTTTTASNGAAAKTPAKTPAKAAAPVTTATPVAAVISAVTPAKAGKAVTPAKTPAPAVVAVVAATPVPAVTPKKAAAVSEPVAVVAPAPVSAAKAKKTPKKAAPATPVVDQEEMEVVSEEVQPATAEVEEEVPKAAKSTKSKTSKIPHAVVASSLQTIQEDEEMLVDEPVIASVTSTAETDADQAEDSANDANKRRRTARSSSVGSVGSVADSVTAAEETPATAATKATRAAAASKIPARAPRVAASPSTATATTAVPVVKAATTAASKLKAPTEIKLTKRTLPAATVKALEVDSDSSVSGLRRSSRARSNSNLSEDSVVSTGSATRKSARTSAQ